MPRSPCREIRHCSGLLERDNWPECVPWKGPEGFLQGDHPSRRPRSQTPGSEMVKPGSRWPQTFPVRPPPPPWSPAGQAWSLWSAGRWGGRGLPAGPTQPGRATPSGRRPPPPIPPPRRPPAPPPLPAGGSSRRRPPLPGPSGRQGGRRERAGRANTSLCGGSAGPGQRPGGCWGRRTRPGPRGHPGCRAGPLRAPRPRPHLVDKTKREAPLPCSCPGACPSFP